MQKRHLWIALVALTLALLSCQFLLPDTTPIPVATPIAESTAAATRRAEPTATSPALATPSSPLPSGLIRDPVTDADRATVLALAQSKPAVRDLRDLAVRLEGVPADTPKVACTTSPNYAVGATHTFSVQNQSTMETFDVKATLRYKNQVVYMWVADGVKAGDAAIKQAADYFADKIYPTDRALLGIEASPGIDCDPHISILNTPGMGGAAGYVAGKDEVTQVVRPDSNEMEMFYMNTDDLAIGSTEYLATAAHEFQHIISDNVHKNLDTWMNEGFSDLAIYLNRFGVTGHAQAYLATPDTQLDAWAELDQAIPHYGESFLFLTHFYDRFGAEATRRLLADPKHGLEAMDGVLATFGKPGMTADDFFADWEIANYLNDSTVAGGQYAYKDLRFNKPRVERTINRFPFALDSAVNHYGTDYFILQGQRDVTVDLIGSTEARLVGADPPDGKLMWYSGRGDNSDFTLTREFDLAGVSSATLKFSTWYSTEEDWDYFYVEASADGGKTWKILKVPGSTNTNPSGNNYGWALTGKSGGQQPAQWIEPSVDLSEFAGKKILLRFEYITDDALNYEGVALQDIRLPEINYAFNADSGDGGWQAQGFVRIINREPEKYTVQLISFGSDGRPRVERLPLADDQTGHWSVSLSQVRNAVLALTALARTTTEPAPYQLKISD